MMTKQLTYTALLEAPQGAKHYIQQTLISMGLNSSQAANKIGVSQSALCRLLNGESSLSPMMAAKLHLHLNLSIDHLFQMEGQVLAYQAALIAMEQH